MKMLHIDLSNSFNNKHKIKKKFDLIGDYLSYREGRKLTYAEIINELLIAFEKYWDYLDDLNKKYGSKNHLEFEDNFLN